MSPAGACPTKYRIDQIRSNSNFAWNSYRGAFEDSRPIITKFGTRHDSRTVVTCTKFRYDRPTITEIRGTRIFSKFWIRRQAIIWTNAGILLTKLKPLGTNFSEILIEIHTFSFKKIHFKMSTGKWRPFCLGPNVLIALLWNLTMQPNSRSHKKKTKRSNFNFVLQSFSSYTNEQHGENVKIYSLVLIFWLKVYSDVKLTHIAVFLSHVATFFAKNTRPLLTEAAELMWCQAVLPSVRPSLCPSLCPSGINFFSNRIGSLSFHLIVPIFGLHVHCNTAKKLWNQNFYFSPNFLINF